MISCLKKGFLLLKHSKQKHGKAYGHIYRASSRANGRVVKCTIWHNKDPNREISDSDVEEMVGGGM